MKSLSVNWLFIMLHFKGKHLERSRALKAYWSDIYRTFINFPYIFKIWKISPVTRHSVTSNTHRRNDKLEYQECTCKLDKSLKRNVYQVWESTWKICIAGNQWDNSDLDIHICGRQEAACMCSDEGRDDFQQLKPKGSHASFVTTVTL